MTGDPCFSVYGIFMRINNSKQQRKSGNESTLKKLNRNTFSPFVLNYNAKTLLLPGCRRSWKTGAGKKNEKLTNVIDFSRYLWLYQINSGTFQSYHFFFHNSSINGYNYHYYNNPLRVVHFHITTGVLPTFIPQSGKYQDQESTGLYN